MSTSGSLLWVTIWSRGVELANQAKRIPSSSAGMALTFGALHALELGHGKTAIITYLAGVSSGSSIAGIKNVILFGLGMCISLMSLVTVCSIFGERVIQRFEHKKIPQNWRLCQGVLFIIVGLVTAIYH